MEPLGMSTVLLLTCISCLLLSALWRSGAQQKGKMPPGPTPLPLIGNALQLKTHHLDQVLQKMSEKYGPVFTLHFGMAPAVVLYGYEAIKEALLDRGNEFAARGKVHLMEKTCKGRGIIFSNGERWKQLRRFALTTLRNFGMGKKSIEERIHDEAQYLLEQFRNTKQQPFDPHYLFSCATSNVICSIVFGKRFDYKDEKFQAMMNLMNENFELFNSSWAQLANTFPTLMDWIPGPHHRLVSGSLRSEEFVLEEAKEHRATLDPSSPRDFIDCFYIKMDQEKHNEASEFTMENLIFCSLDLFGAGTETTSTTLRYGLLILQKYPEIEEKVQEEIDRVVGRSRLPGMADRGQMPYTDAVLHEIQRFVSLVPVGVPHAVDKDTPFRGYVIPKGTIIVPVLTSVLHDSKEFPNPTEFDPGHFLNKDGTFRKSDYFVPFSTGKRICAGEGLARMELFLFLTSILQNFKLKSLTDPKDIDIMPRLSSLSNVPQPYKFCLVPR
ncbi:cytochrome P450 2C29-like [Anolis sagrei]|uniref:cytochrome P450 2C29-like n=1 Tax=Anolis sagrei TaxID=38937 RepID=UPI00295C1216|nr:cytochrome P450 2C29-like [Anolis sagrei ordinatus]